MLQEFFDYFEQQYFICFEKIMANHMYQIQVTIDRSFSWQDDDDELKSRVCVFQVSEHGLHAVCSLGVFTETRLALDGHPSIL